MDNKIEVIGIDHGWSGMKTIHEVFTSGCKEISTEPAFTENLLGYGGKYYKIGSRRLEVKDTKVTDENYYMLTLAAVAKELKIRGKKSSFPLIRKNTIFSLRMYVSTHSVMRRCRRDETLWQFWAGEYPVY